MFFLLHFLQTLAQGQSYSCDPNGCKLPTCRCASVDPPISDPPQFVVLTYDDALNADSAALGPLTHRTNPNGCPVVGTWFAQVFYSDPGLMLQWYALGNEVADHSVTHGLFSPVQFAGSYAEFEGMRAWANQIVGLPLEAIKGVRFPFRNYTVDSINTISQMGFEYDSSLSAFSNDKFWPYTLDNGVANECYAPSTVGPSTITVCGQKLKAPGLWEVPLYGFSTLSGQHLMDPYNDYDIKSPVALSEIQKGLTDAFDASYNGKRAPFGIYMHPVWLGPAVGDVPDGSAKQAMIKTVLDYAQSHKDVWMVTNAQLVAYMKNPVPASQLGAQSYMSCDFNPPLPTNICNGVTLTNVESCSYPNGSFSSCHGCPDSYPTLANPSPHRSTSRCALPTSCDALYWDPVGCVCLCNKSTCAFNDPSRPINLDPSSSTVPSTSACISSISFVPRMSHLVLLFIVLVMV